MQARRWPRPSRRPRRGLLRVRVVDIHSTDKRSRSRDMFCPSFACRYPLAVERAQGRPGARCTRGLVCNMHEEVRTRAYRSSGEHPAFPAQWFDGLCRVLPGDEFLLPPSLCELTAKSEPGWANFVFAKLDASHGRQDHTVLPYATTSLVLRGINRSQHSPPCDLPRAQRHRVHRNPHSTYRDDAYAPLHEAGWREEDIDLRR